MLTPVEVNVLFEGNLSPERTVAKVLAEVLAAAPTDTAVLRIACPASNVGGRLAIARGRYIVGAQIDGDAESGYAAVRKLLAIGDGNFAFLDAEGKLPFDVDPALHIAVEHVLELLPSLPENANELFDEKALLDEVFAAGRLKTGEDSYEVLPHLAPEASADSDTQAQHQSAWAAIQPLLLNEGGCPQQGPLLAGFGHQGGSHPLSADARPITLGKLKAAALNRLSWWRPAALAAIAILLAVLALTAWSLKSHWWELSFSKAAPAAPAGHRPQ